MQEFHYVEPEILIKLINVYATSFYGSSTWDIFSKDCERLYRSWNVTIRQVFGLHRCTHRYLIEHVSGCLHPQAMLASRLVSFHKSMVTYGRVPVRLLATMNERDLRTVHGRTLHTIQALCGQPHCLTSSVVKRICRYKETPEDEMWRLPLLSELLQVMKDNLSVENFSNKEIDDFINYLCTN